MAPGEAETIINRFARWSFDNLGSVTQESPTKHHKSSHSLTPLLSTNFRYSQSSDLEEQNKTMKERQNNKDAIIQDRMNQLLAGALIRW